MAEHTFAQYLRSELDSSRCALLALYEERDRIKYIDGPNLENEYMNAVGAFEESVIKEEIECELLKKKQQMIQTAINRQEPVDEAAIDAMLSGEREKLLSEAGSDAVTAGFYALSSEEAETLQKLYKEIVRDFHPQIHPELTEVQRQLFQKAQEVYRCRDLAALTLIYEMLHSTTIGELPPGIFTKVSFDECEEFEKNGDHTTDYALAKQIYGAFRATSEEIAMQEEWLRCRQVMETVMQEVTDMRSEFPFTAAEMLSSPERIQAYKEELMHRLHTATVERERRTGEIREMLAEVKKSE